MINAKPLIAKQFAVVKDLFKGELKEKAILQKNKLSRKLYDKWLVDETFAGRLDKRLVREYRSSEFMLARYTLVVRQRRMRLIRHRRTDKPETARKACIDMITIRTDCSAVTSATPENDCTLQNESHNLSPETSGRLLALLAEEKNNLVHRIVS